ncbi:MAG: hemolysin family protein [Clostridiales bacterium]|nr:hemolysin family protein [Clostridiales bacterium]
MISAFTEFFSSFFSGKAPALSGGAAQLASSGELDAASRGGELMSAGKILIYILVVFLMLLLSAFFSGSEISFNSANRMRLRQSAEDKVSCAKLALRISEHFTTALCTILIGNNLANIAASTCATALFIDLFYRLFSNHGLDAAASAVATVVMTVIVLIFGEIIPKILAKQHADRVVLWVAVPIRILTVLLFPPVLLVLGLLFLLRKIWGKDNSGGPDVTEDELASIIDTVEEEGIIDEGQSELLQSSLEFHDTAVEEIMTPRIDLVTIDIDDDPEEIRKTVEGSIYSRIPVYRETIDDIIGVLYLNQYYKATVENPDAKIEDMLIKPLFLHKTMKLPAALHHLRDRKTHMAIVIDEFGGTLGVVTVEDILEEIVGDIWDETDEIIPDIVPLGEDRFEINGDMNIDDFFYEFDYVPHDFECEYSTVGGWAIESLNSDPHVGDVFDYAHFHILVSEMEDEVRVTKLIVTVGKTEEEKEEEEEEGNDASDRADE